MKRVFSSVIMLCLAVQVSMASLFRPSRVIVVGGDDCIFVNLLRENGKRVKTAGSLESALRMAARGDGVIVCADGYPQNTASIRQEDYASFARKGARLFVEYPSELPGNSHPEKYTASLERGVITSSEVGLPEMSIVGINGCRLVVTESDDPLIVLAKVAGYDTAVFGIDDVELAYPVLYHYGSAMIATTAISNAVRGRYGPAESWKKIVSFILGWVCGDSAFDLDSFPCAVNPMYGHDAALPLSARADALTNAVKWLDNANLYIHPSWEEPLMKKYQPVGGDPNRFFGEPITDDMLQGDGTRGVMEGHASSINENGDQEYRYFIRADVQGESAFLLAAGSAASGNFDYALRAENLLDYLFYTSCFRQNERADENTDVYGLLGWSNTAPTAFFNDDNARCILGAIGASSLMDNQRWNKPIVENILANFRLASSDGFIGSSLWQHEIQDKGWEWFSDRPDFKNPSPHFESWMMALYLWLYGRTGYAPLLEKAKAGITNMMESYPDWKVQNGIQQERARMILPLAWLVRVEDNEQNREWLDTVVTKFLENQDECGAIPEELGNKGLDHNNLLISSNSEYGKNEASLIARNGDPVADMLYTCNFGFFALNEAHQATGKYGDAVNKLADFLVRIQVSSDSHKDLDGAWFRAFDYGRWDYWASNADNGWGAWCTLCGWIETWIAVTEYLVDKGTSYWDATSNMQMTPALENSLWMLERQ